MNPEESATAILAALRAALAAKITAGIGFDAVEDGSPEGYSLTLMVMVDGSGAHFGDDLAAASADLARRVDEAIADRAKLA